MGQRQTGENIDSKRHADTNRQRNRQRHRHTDSERAQRDRGGDTRTE